MTKRNDRKLCERALDEMGPSGFVANGPLKRAIPVTAVWLRRIGDEAQVLVELDGRGWVVAIREHAEGSYSHIAEASGADDWSQDEVTGSPR